MKLASFLVSSALLACAGHAAQVEVKPVEKVITLLEDLKKQVEDEGKTEAGTYDKFACWCKDGTDSKTGSITDAESSINELTANLESLTSQRAQLSDEISQLEKDIAKFSSELDQENADYAEERATDEAIEADLTAANSALDRAIDTMKKSKSPSLVEVKAAIRVVSAAAISHGLKLSAKQQATVSQLLKQPEIPDEDYSFHSDDIISTLEDMKTEFAKNLADHQGEMEKKKHAHEEAVEGLTDKIDAAKKSKGEKEELFDEVGRDIAADQEELITTQANLKDDQLYLKDLTTRCENRANQWDQRSKMRADELTAISQALEIISGTVSEKDTAANKRALVQVDEEEDEPIDESVFDKAGAYVPRVGSASESLNVAESLAFVETEVDTTGMSPKQAALAVLKQSATKLNSAALQGLAAKIEADPFGKVKQLIQQLIERLLQESADEASQKGWCDAETAKAKHTRDEEQQAIEMLVAEIEGNEARRDTLDQEIEDLKVEIKELNEELTKATEDRHEESEENATTVKDAKEGRDAVAEAIKILTEFYKGAAKAFVQASPIDGDNPGAGFDSHYKGNQEAGGGIIGMLEVIHSDFDRTVRKTQEAEEQAHREFVVFDRETKVSLAEKETVQGQKESELEQTESKLVEQKDSLTTHQKLLDESLKELEKLRPACVDTGMTFEERTARREAEIAALKKALEILAPPAFLQKN